MIIPRRDNTNKPTTTKMIIPVVSIAKNLEKWFILIFPLLNKIKKHQFFIVQTILP
jgi:hypothetical protein